MESQITDKNGGITEDDNDPTKSKSYLISTPQRNKESKDPDDPDVVPRRSDTSRKRRLKRTLR